MDDSPRKRFTDDALMLLSAAERLERDAGDRACAPILPAALASIEQTLLALSRGVDDAAHCLIPPVGRDEGISRRYARAAADWPGGGEGGGPSYERQAQLLASLHETGAALHVAAHCCRRTGERLSRTMEAPVELADLRDRRVSTRAA